MKKITTLVCAGLVLAVSAFADITFGARGNFALGIGTTTNITGAQTNNLRSVDYGATVFGKFPVSVVNNMYVQPELGFNRYTTSLKMNDSDIKATIGYNAIILPVLVSYDIPINQSFSLYMAGGPRFSFITGDMSYTQKSVTVENDPDSRIMVGAIAGLGAQYALSTNACLVTDLRYDFGVSPLKFKDASEEIKPRGLNFSAGFTLTF